MMMKFHLTSLIVTTTQTIITITKVIIIKGRGGWEKTLKHSKN